MARTTKRRRSPASPLNRHNRKRGPGRYAWHAEPEKERFHEQRLRRADWANGIPRWLRQYHSRYKGPTTQELR